MWATPLIEWYTNNKRDLPWRSSRNPYHIMVCEFMAQQTQIATLIPYYSRWLDTFPMLEDVANADEDRILKCWEGLGYYSRARNLQKACQVIVNQHKGNLPENPDELMALPGIGPYIAAAIASIAFNVPIAVVDGNVLRVMARFYGLRDDIGKEKTKQALQRRLNQDIKQYPPSDFNQGLMELGATVCTPKAPNCGECPLAVTCYAKNMNETETLPIKSKKKPIPHHTIVVGIIKNNHGKVLITKRKKNQLLGGLWEFPGGKVEENETIEDALTREIKEEVALDIAIESFACKVNHAYSHFKITMHAYICIATDTNPLHCTSADAHEWVTLSELNRFAFPKANNKIIAHLIAENQLA